MTYRALAKWVHLDVLLGMPLPERVKYVRTNLEAPPRKRVRDEDPWMSQPEFAAAVGASDRAIVSRWEKKKMWSTPARFAVKIAALTPYPPQAFGAEGEAELVRKSLGTRLQKLERQFDAFVKGTTERLVALEEGQEPGAQQSTGRSGPPELP